MENGNFEIGLSAVEWAESNFKISRPGPWPNFLMTRLFCDQRLVRHQIDAQFAAHFIGLLADQFGLRLHDPVSLIEAQLIFLFQGYARTLFSDSFVHQPEDR